MSDLVNLSGQAVRSRTDAGLDLLVEGVGVLEGERAVMSALWRVVINVAKGHGEDGNPEKGLRLIEDTATMGLPSRDRDLLRGVYVTWTAEAARAGARARCLKAAKQGMAAFPRDDAIRNNYDYCMDL